MPQGKVQAILPGPGEGKGYLPQCQTGVVGTLGKLRKTTCDLGSKGGAEWNMVHLRVRKSTEGDWGRGVKPKRPDIAGKESDASTQRTLRGH